MPKLIHLLHIINPENNKDISNAVQLLSLKINIKTDKEILFGNEEYLISKSGIDKKLFDIIKKRIINYYSGEILNGEELLNNYLNDKENLKKDYYSFGNNKIDNLINGGILQGEIIELVGSPSTGKTQLSFLLSLNVLLSDIKNTVLYLDTKNSFSIKRIIDFYYSKNNKIEKHSEDIKDLISRIKHQGVYNYHELFNILEEIMKDISHNINNNIGKFNKYLKLIVINSISSLIFPIIGQDYTRNSVMSSISQYLNILSRTYKISILLTNFTVGAKYSNIYNNPTNTLEYYNKKRNLYEHQKICNIKIKDVILKQYQQNHPQNQYPPNEKKKELFINENEEIIAQLINELNDDFSQCIEVNKTTNNIIIRDFKKPSLGNIWTYTPDIQLFLTSLSSPLSSSHINHQKNVNNINNKQNNYNINEITQNSKRQKLNNNDEEIIKKIEVVLSHRTNIGQYCTFCINKNGIS
jgi:RecA/RadA recombinase